MKKLMMAVMVMGLCAGFNQVKAQGMQQQDTKIPFSISFGRLSQYLQLTPSQMNEVYAINDQFMEAQQALMQRNQQLREKRMPKVIYGNLKQMKQALSEAQYRQYVTLLNVTNNNNRLESGNNLTDIYLAQKD